MKAFFKKLFISRPVSAYIAFVLTALHCTTFILYLLYATYPNTYIPIRLNGWMITFFIIAILLNGFLFVRPNEYIAMAALTLPALTFGLFIIDPLTVGSLLDRAMTINILGNAFLVPQILTITILLSICILTSIACVICSWKKRPQRAALPQNTEKPILTNMDAKTTDLDEVCCKIKKSY